MPEREKFVCMCGQKCVSKQSYEMHWTRKHKNRKFQLPLTKEKVNNRGSQNSDYLFHCDYCKKGFGRKDNLKSHMMMTHGFNKKQFQCHICDKSYLYVSNLNVHIKLVHSAALASQNVVCSHTIHTIHSFLYYSFISIIIFIHFDITDVGILKIKS